MPGLKASQKPSVPWTWGTEQAEGVGRGRGQELLWLLKDLDIFQTLR